jgi:hypothetical protein
MGTQASKKSSSVAFQSQETIGERAARERCHVPAQASQGMMVCSQRESRRIEFSGTTGGLWQTSLSELSLRRVPSNRGRTLKT